MRFYYHSRVGQMEIVPANGRWVLCISGTAYGSYHSPEAAADDVYTQTTGHDRWDMGPMPLEPSDISEWEQS